MFPPGFKSIARFIAEHPITSAAVALVLFGASLGAAIFVVANNDVSISEAGIQMSPQRGAIQGRGFYRDIVEMENGVAEYRIGFEQVDLTAYRSGTLRGYTSGYVLVGPDRRRDDRVWPSIGYLNGDRIVFSYYTARTQGQQSISTGVGNYLLKQVGANWVGTITFWDSQSEVIAMCPYVLVIGSAGAELTPEQALGLYPALARPCIDTESGETIRDAAQPATLPPAQEPLAPT